MLDKPRIRLNNLRTSLRFPCLGLNPIIDANNLFFFFFFFIISVLLHFINHLVSESWVALISQVLWGKSMVFKNMQVIVTPSPSLEKVVMLYMQNRKADQPAHLQFDSQLCNCTESG